MTVIGRVNRLFQAVRDLFVLTVVNIFCENVHKVYILEIFNDPREARF